LDEVISTIVGGDVDKIKLGELAIDSEKFAVKTTVSEISTLLLLALVVNANRVGGSRSWTKK
jgi:hypothetical protein